jgi:hypothetical protein
VAPVSDYRVLPPARRWLDHVSAIMKPRACAASVRARASGRCVVSFGIDRVSPIVRERAGATLQRGKRRR